MLCSSPNVSDVEGDWGGESEIDPDWAADLAWAGSLDYTDEGHDALRCALFRFQADFPREAAFARAADEETARIFDTYMGPAPEDEHTHSGGVWGGDWSDDDWEWEPGNAEGLGDWIELLNQLHNGPSTRSPLQDSLGKARRRLAAISSPRPIPERVDLLRDTIEEIEHALRLEGTCTQGEPLCGSLATRGGDEVTSSSPTFSEGLTTVPCNTLDRVTAPLAGTDCIAHDSPGQDPGEIIREAKRPKARRRLFEPGPGPRGGHAQDLLTNLLMGRSVSDPVKFRRAQGGPGPTASTTACASTFVC